MLHIIISLTICAINVNYPILKPETYKILVNYRCGIIINQSKEEIVDYIFHTYNINTQEYNFFIYPEFKNNKNYNIDSYISSKNLIQQSIKLQIIWVINCFNKILLNLGCIDNNIPFISVIMNYFDLYNYIRKIEINYRHHLLEIKQIKDEMISISTNKLFNKNVFITKRIKSKERNKRKSKKIKNQYK